MKHSFLFLLSAFIGITSAQAQDTTSFWAKRQRFYDNMDHFGYLGAGYQYTQYMDFTNQPSVLGNDFSLNGNAFTLSGTGYSICHRLLFGGEFGGSVSNPSPDARKVSGHVSQLFGYFNFGYLVVYTEKTMLYPYIGIGGAYIGLTMRNKTNTDMVFDNFTIQAGERGNFSAGGVGLQAGVGFKKSMFKCEKGYALMLGLDLGVRFMPYKSNWYYDGNSRKVNDFGFADNTGYYAKLTIGRGVHK